MFTAAPTHPDDHRAHEIFHATRTRDLSRLDRIFAAAMILQFVATLAAALNARSLGGYGVNQMNVWGALLAAAAITLLAVTMALKFPGRAATRYAIAIGQMLFGVILGHLTRDRVELRFHVFGSLAMLALYSDWKVLVSAAGMAVIDHFVSAMLGWRGADTVVAMGASRWLEPAGWIGFEVGILIFVAMRNRGDKMAIAVQQARLEDVGARIEREVGARTAELQKSEAQLKQSEIKLRKIFDACPETICINSLRDGRYIDANLVLSSSGYTLDELNHAAGNSRPVWADRAQLRAFAREVIEHDIVQNMEVEFKTKSGASVPALISGAKIELDGEPCVVSFSSDISRLKHTQRRLIEAKEAALAASRAKSEFLSTMSHEIRTPMNAILGMADLLCESPLMPEQKKFVSTMVSNGNALLTLINGILDLARIESGRLSLEPAEFEIEELLEQVAETLAVRAHEKKLELTTRVAAGLPRTVVGDPLRLRQVLINLVGNAIKFTEQGEVAMVAQSEEGSAGQVRVRFAVRDTGIGIPPGQLDAIFQSFTQADSSATRKYGGTGLGLTIASRLVELMDGRLVVASEVGRGSIFEFVAQLKPADLQAIAEEPLLELAGMRLLIVDDNATNRLILNEMLSSLGAQVTEAESGHAALTLLDRANLANAPFELVLLDCGMPGMDGFQVAAELKRRVTGTSQIVLMLTSDDLNRTLESARALGIEVYLLKPLRRHELVRAIARVLGADRIERKAVAARSGREATTETQVRPLHILLADDSIDNRNLISAYLQKLPYRIDNAENGEIAFARFIAGKYDLVLMDMLMPVLDGYGAVRNIRAWETAHGRAPTPIAALTASALEEDVRRTLEAGCTSHLTKPIKKSRLLQAILDLTKVSAASLDSTPGEIIDARIATAPEFLERKRRDLYAMTAALERNDYQALRSIARRTKGEGVGPGFESISDIGDALEEAAHRRDVAEVSRQVRALSDCLNRIEVRSAEQPRP